MALNVQREIAALQRLSVTQLRQRDGEVFGEPTRAGNKPWLIKRIAWRMQAIEEGGLSERAQRRAVELANDADLRINPPRTPAAEPTPERVVVQPVPAKGDLRLPPPGTVLTRPYKGRWCRSRWRLVRLLVQRVDFDGAKGNLTITFYPTGIQALADELASKHQEKSA